MARNRCRIVLNKGAIMFYQVKFTEWNMHADNKRDLKKKIRYFIKNRISPKIIDIQEQTKEEYIERLLLQYDNRRNAEYRRIMNEQ